MTSAATVAWLAQLQLRFGATLSTPLDASTGVMRADIERYLPEACADVLPSETLGAGERIAIYHRQRWMRLLRTLQEQYPLTTRLLGAWGFNQRASRFLVAHPPRARDLGDVVEGFDAFLADGIDPDDVRGESAGPRLPRKALLEAAALDAAYRHVFRAPERPALEPGALTEADLQRKRLQLSDALAVTTEHWPLTPLRLSVLRDSGESPVALPAPLSVPQSWAVHRSERGVAQLLLHPLQARLLLLLPQAPVAGALAQLESECDRAQRAQLPALVRELLSQGVHRGFFCGLEDV